MSSNDRSKLQVSQLGKKHGEKTGVNLHEFPCCQADQNLVGKMVKPCWDTSTSNQMLILSGLCNSASKVNVQCYVGPP